MRSNGEGGASQHDPDQHQGQRDVQPDGDHGEGRRKGRKENHDGDDEPDMVGLPDGTDGLVDQSALRLAVTTHGKESPDPCSEIRSTEQQIQSQGTDQRGGDYEFIRGHR